MTIKQKFNEFVTNPHYTTNESKLGLLGELIIQEYFGGEMSDNVWDHEKDLIIEGEGVEIKTQARWKLKNAFTIPYSTTQYNKCKNVPHLVFVEPGKNKEIRIYEDLRMQRDFNTTTDTYGRKRYTVNVNNTTLVHTLQEPEIWDLIMKYSGTETKYLV
jgi:hypothetical protein